MLNGGKEKAKEDTFRILKSHKLRNYTEHTCSAQIKTFQFAQLFINCAINCARRIAQFVNSDLGFVPRPRSLVAVTQLGWKLHYSPAAVIQPPLSLHHLRSQILVFDGPNQLCTRTRHGRLSKPNSRLYSGLLAPNLGCPLSLTFALALSQPLPAWRALVHN